MFDAHTKQSKKYRILKIRNIQTNFISYSIQKRRSFCNYEWWTTIKENFPNLQLAKQYVCKLIAEEPGSKNKIEQIIEM